MPPKQDTVSADTMGRMAAPVIGLALGGLGMWGIVAGLTKAAKVVNKSVVDIATEWSGIGSEAVLYIAAASGTAAYHSAAMYVVPAGQAFSGMTMVTSALGAGLTAAWSSVNVMPDGASTAWGVLGGALSQNQALMNAILDYAPELGGLTNMVVRYTPYAILERMLGVSIASWTKLAVDLTVAPFAVTKLKGYFVRKIFNLVVAGDLADKALAMRTSLAAMVEDARAHYSGMPTEQLHSFVARLDALRAHPGSDAGLISDLALAMNNALADRGVNGVVTGVLDGNYDVMLTPEQTEIMTTFWAKASAKLLEHGHAQVEAGTNINWPDFAAVQADWLAPRIHEPGQPYYRVGSIFGLLAAYTKKYAPAMTLTQPEAMAVLERASEAALEDLRAATAQSDVLLKLPLPDEYSGTIIPTVANIVFLAWQATRGVKAHWCRIVILGVGGAITSISIGIVASTVALYGVAAVVGSVRWVFQMPDRVDDRDLDAMCDEAGTCRYTARERAVIRGRANSTLTIINEVRL